MTQPTPIDTPSQADSAIITRQQWKWSALAGMASYLDAGSIVALGAGMVLFQKRFGMTDGIVGALAAIGPNAIGCALGAFLGGWLGDKAQGFSFGAARIAVGVWSFFVPTIFSHGGISMLATLLTLFLVISGAVGFFFMPNTSGKSLEQIEGERAGT